ncbi:MAG: carbohydrate ABC transporter permease [Anaerolineae bacterium]
MKLAPDTSALQPARARASEVSRRWLTKDQLSRELVFILVSGGAIIMLLPFAWMISTSLKSPAEVFAYPIIWLPEQPMWSNYARVFNLAGFDRMYLNSLFVASASVTLNLLTSSLAGFAFARLRFRGRDTLFLLYLATLMIPGQVTLIPVFILIRALGWYDSYAALIAPSAVSVFSTFLLRQFFRSIPMDLDEAARMDGAGSLRIWWQIALPLARPALATVVILGFLGSWNDFLWPLIVIHSRSLWTIPLGLSAFQGQYNVEWHLLMAGASIAVLPILLVYLVGQKWIVQATAVASRGNA